MTDLDRLYRLRDLLARAGKRGPNDSTGDIDRSIRQLIAEIDRRDGPGTGETLGADLAGTLDPWKA